MRVRAILLACVLAVLVSGCGSISYNFVSGDRELAGQLAELRATGGQRPLRDFVPGDWTSVHVFIDPITRDFVEREVGRPVDQMGARLGTGNLLVFMRGDEVDRVILTASREISAGTSSPGTTEYGPGVLLSAPPGASLLYLDEPS